jgi:DNA-binding beta-propeller fold protein YncE
MEIAETDGEKHVDRCPMLKTCACLLMFGAITMSFIPDQAERDVGNSLRLEATIPLPAISGRIDHLALDSARQRLFVAALGNDSVEVVDTVRNVHVRSLPGFHEPQGLAVVPDLNAVAVANGDSGTLQLVDAATLETRWTISIGGDADNVRYEPGTKRVFVAYQDGIAAVDPVAARVVWRIHVSGHPESFQLESQGTRLFANVPGWWSSEVVVADRSTTTVIDRRSTGACQANYPMALDENTHRLLIGCRRPASLTLFETDAGKSLGAIPVVGDADDLFYDGDRRRVYVIGGDGFIDVVQRDHDTLRRIARVPTRDGARTGMWIAEQSRLYLAVPARRGQPAEIRVFAAQE